MKTGNRLTALLLAFVLPWLLAPAAQAQGSPFQQTLDAFTQSYEAEAAGNYQGAIDALMAHYQARHYAMNLRLGWLHYLTGAYDRAVQYYRRAVSLKPLSIEARLGLVIPLAALGNMDEVLTTYKQILDIDPNHALTHYRVGALYYAREDFRMAERHFEKVVNHYPFDADSLLMLAWTKYRLGKRDEARLLFEQVLLYNPANVSAREGLDLTAQ